MGKITILLITAVTALLFVACGRQEPRLGKCKAYLYKGSVSNDGLICIFYSSNQYVAEGNARIFAEMHKEKFGIPLIVSKKPF